MIDGHTDIDIVGVNKNPDDRVRKQNVWNNVTE